MTRAARSPTKAGSAYQAPTATNRVPASAAAARSRYSCEPMEDAWGVRTRPMTWSTPRAANVAAASSMNGSVCLAPNATT